MLLEFDADQRLWQETVRDAVTKQCPATLVREVAEQGVDPAPLWQSYIDQGWTELTDPENAVELAIVLEELGRATDLTPYLATMTQYAPLAGDRFDPAKAGAAVLEGVTAYRDADGWLLNGTALHVLDADRAEALAVVTDGGVFLVDADKAIITRRQVFDPVLHVAEVSFTNVHVDDTDRVHADTEKARHLALTGMAITMVGACQRVLDLALEHVKQRQQFGVAIGSFQAVQHKAVDMHVAIERARALSYFAALTIAADDPRRRLASAMAKAAAGECQAVVFRHGLQLFGAMGFTWENDVQFALKRAKAGELLLGGAAEHRALIAAEYRTTYRGL
ncbi:alkylation response protein AidB-like acyl-CoA dehydrogenase [Mycobacterium frederiksbergense]|uniref:Alkylation response protein AidB-like acyl-CoA dehydrogenase n=1 Tax=Mycolicibacterium frederiksbergense TaxID=117567 RepID=A0ABT6KX43_9MYCO|nr:acyl-CoA dehydrogenase family protein [Mycolicibacterium frederiksbergense]MDH6194530.1 alkylation response protein AidB-like acyl-CoA dehydrogenase [Mycolicibacterium frederiksbergense]